MLQIHPIGGLSCYSPDFGKIIPKGLIYDRNRAHRLTVRDTRKRQNLTQEQLAATAGVGVRFIRELEHGKDRHIGKVLPSWRWGSSRSTGGSLMSADSVMSVARRKNSTCIGTPPALFDAKHQWDVGFVYDPDFVHTASMGISLSLPLQEEPSRMRGRRRACCRMKASDPLGARLGVSDKPFLLNAVGGLRRALSFYPPGETPPSPRTPISTFWMMCSWPTFWRG